VLKAMKLRQYEDKSLVVVKQFLVSLVQAARCEAERESKACPGKASVYLAPWTVRLLL
jgi:hypothetical protein